MATAPLAVPRKQRTILTVRAGAMIIAEVADKPLPIEITPTVDLSSAGSLIKMVDSNGLEYGYDLGSAVEEGARFAHFSIRVSDGFAAEADCLLSASPVLSLEEFKRYEVKGIRLQPFYLPECQADPAELEGRSLFFRGLHFAGTVTPGNVSLLCICDRCRRSFRLQSFHAGFSNLVYFYCETGTHTLVVSSYADGAPPLLVDVTNEQLAAFEAKLPSCGACGTRFRFYNSLRCRWCHAPYLDFERHPRDRKNEYYGNYFYGQRLQECELPSTG